jgi:hypothetical protein
VGERHRHMRNRKCKLRSAPALLLVAFALGCSSEPRALRVGVTTGAEKNVFSRDPEVTKVVVSATDVDGTIIEATTEPGGTFDLGEVPADSVFTFEIEGRTADGDAVVRGRSIAGIAPQAVEGSEVPLFAQRVNEWARPPDGVVRSHLDGAAGVLGERYLLLTGGTKALSDEGSVDAASADYYDLFALAGAVGTALPRTPKSLVSFGDLMLLVDDDGATWVSFSEGTVAEAQAPEGLSGFGAVAGGRALLGPDERIYVVGCTRAAAPTRDVLVVSSDGSLAAAKLSQARAGAAAAFVEGTGLVVFGGATEGAGVEVLAQDAEVFEEKGFPADATEGAALVRSASKGLVLVGGTSGDQPATTRRIDPTCLDRCATPPLDGADVPEALTSVQAFALKDGKVVAIGEDGRGWMRTFLVDLTGSSLELPLRESRRGATVVPAPNGTLAILGGVDEDGSAVTSVETLFPD